ncbi:MAG: hypothetical protein M3450_04615 [Actinomycetota bacterium]|nr:hypothetical protein [Actinomycetota bacterium]
MLRHRVQWTNPTERVLFPRRRRWLFLHDEGDFLGQLDLLGFRAPRPPNVGHQLLVQGSAEEGNL